MMTGMFCLFLIMQTSAQEKVNVSIGIGLPELLNAGVRYQANQTQLGLSVGSLPLKDESILSVSGDMFLHFGGQSKLSSRRNWYGRIGLEYLKDETKTVIDKFLYANVRFGRDINFTRKMGIAIDAGFMVEVISDRTFKEPPTGWIFNFDFPILPSLGVGMFYRI